MRATAAPVVPRRERFVIFKTSDVPAPYPRLELLPDGRLLAGVPLNTAVDFFVHGELHVLVSVDQGATCSTSDDPQIPLNWPGSSTRERWDRATRVLSDGTCLGTGAIGSEAALAENGPDRVLALIRADPSRGGSGHLLASWSEDGGRSWTLPSSTEIWGRPPHLLNLADGRLLCTFGHQRAPLGVQAVLSDDGGETWDVDHAAVVADDGESSDVGYHPMSVQLPDGSVYTAYYTTRGVGAVPHSVGVRWELPW